MKRVTLLLVLVLCLSPVARADEVSRRAKATEMINLLHLDRLMAQTMDAMKKQTRDMSKQMAGNNITPEEQAKVDDFQQKVFNLIEAQIGWKVMEPEFVNLYAKTFTEEELDGILAFYKSPVGISMVEKLPVLNVQASQLTQAKMAEIQPQLRQMLSDFAKSAASSAPKASDPKGK